VVRTDSQTLARWHLRHVTYQQAARPGRVRVEGPPASLRSSWIASGPVPSPASNRPRSPPPPAARSDHQVSIPLPGHNEADGPRGRARPTVELLAIVAYLGQVFLAGRATHVPKQRAPAVSSGQPRSLRAGCCAGRPSPTWVGEEAETAWHARGQESRSGTSMLPSPLTTGLALTVLGPAQ
jgi:hypothetical protein